MPKKQFIERNQWKHNIKYRGKYEDYYIYEIVSEDDDLQLLEKLRILCSKISSSEYEDTAIFNYVFKDIDIFIDKTSTPESLYNQFVEMYKARQKKWNNIPQTMKRKDWEKKQRDIELRIRNNLKIPKDDKFFGYKFNIADGRVEVIIILDKIANFVGKKNAEALFLQMKERNLDSDEILYTFTHDCANNVEEFINKIKANDHKLYDGKSSCPREKQKIKDGRHK